MSIIMDKVYVVEMLYTPKTGCYWAAVFISRGSKLNSQIAAFTDKVHAQKAAGEFAKRYHMQPNMFRVRKYRRG